MTELSLISLLAAFGAGLVTFIAPCTLPLVPAFLGFIAGRPPADLSPQSQLDFRKRVFTNAVFYVIGFTLVFVLLGVSAAALGQLLLNYRSFLEKIAGVFLVILGLMLVGVLNIPGLSADKRIPLPAFLRRSGKLTAFFTGIALAIGWSPCVGPILASILLLAGTAGKAFEGGILLFVFSLGLAVPYLIAAWSAGQFITRVQKLANYFHIISVAGGVILIGVGILIFTGQFVQLINWGFRLLEPLNYKAIYRFL